MRLNVTGYGGLIIASPVILYELWRFVTPGLRAHEKRFAVPLVVASAVLFAMGAAVAWITFPHALGFLPRRWWPRDSGHLFAREVHQAHSLPDGNLRTVVRVPHRTRRLQLAHVLVCTTQPRPFSARGNRAHRRCLGRHHTQLGSIFHARACGSDACLLRGVDSPWKDCRSSCAWARAREPENGPSTCPGEHDRAFTTGHRWVSEPSSGADQVDKADEHEGAITTVRTILKSTPRFG